CAAVLSAQLFESTDPPSTAARRQAASGSALLLEDSSAVTTKRPSPNRPASRLGVLMGHPALRRGPVTSTQQVDPGRRSLELPIHRLLQVLDLILKQRQASRALPRLHPNAALVGIDLAVAVRPHPAARP